MTETVLETFDDVKFIQGATKMNQTNWQTYFGASLPNGIYKGLMVETHPGNDIVTDGIAFVNGLMAVIETQDGYTEIGNCSTNDRFVCLRVYLQEEKAQIIGKGPTIDDIDWTDADVVQMATLAQMQRLLYDESYLCTRNEFYWDVPLFYQCQANLLALSYGRNLNRYVNLNEKRVVNPQITGEDTILPIAGRNSYTANSLRYLFLDSIDKADGATYFLGTQNSIKLAEMPWTNFYSFLAPNNVSEWYYYNSEFKANYVFSNPSDWSHETGWYTLTTAGDVDKILRFTWLKTDSAEYQGRMIYHPTFFVEVI